MIDEVLLRLPYLLIFLPLIMSVFVNFVSGRRSLKYINYTMLFSLLVISMFLLMKVFVADKNIFMGVDNDMTILGTDYKINVVNLFYIVLIILINLIGFLNYNHEYPLQKTTNVGYKKIFYSIYSMHIFSIIGMLTTYNTFNLFLFMELFSFSAFSLMNSYRGRSINVAVYKYFTNNIFGSMVLACSIFYLTMFFNTNDILLIKQQMRTLNIAKNHFVIFIYLLIIISVSLKFLMFNVRDQEEKKRFLTILSIDNIFISTIIGLFLIYFFTNFVFSFNSTIFTVSIVRIIILLSFLCAISYILYNTIIHTKTIYDIFLDLFLVDIVYILLAIFFTDNNSYFKAHLLSLTELAITNVPIYFISIYFSEIYNDNNLALLSKQKLLKIFLLFLLFYKLSIPYTTSFYLLKILIKNAILKSSAVFFIIRGISELVFIVLIAKVFLNKENNSEIEKVELAIFQAFKYKISLFILFLFAIFVSFCVIKLA